MSRYAIASESFAVRDGLRHQATKPEAFISCVSTSVSQPLSVVGTSPFSSHSR
ncbi:hypothetical protein [Mycolicibacterium lutetiense]|uniref:Uncharacterized protein n=1 Tax=Mycolicibacterium lutetiense TaxID=1641992 RepID=A0ABS4ZQW6_9MYCO|nr:hypothetical protein [Mycolicibacterium lutetiense]MBP2451895.1 hypothetical protein [Mycolicibacterium lutetiense]